MAKKIVIAGACRTAIGTMGVVTVEFPKEEVTEDES